MIDNSYIYGEIEVETTTESSGGSGAVNTGGTETETETETASANTSGSVYTSFDGSSYNFAFCDIEYNKSDFDAVVTFEKYVPDGGGDLEYFVYEVTITIYTASTTERFADSARITSLTGAVENK